MAATQVLTHADCVEVARRHFGQEDVRVSHWKETRLGGDKPAGYLGAHRLVKIYASVGDSAECVHIFVKTIPVNENQATTIEATGAFRKEMLFYREMVRGWEEFGIIPKQSLAERMSEASDEPGKLAWNCHCYISRDNLVVLDDISKLGYTSDNARDVYDYDHVLFVIKSIAKFHAASLTYEDRLSAQRKKPFRIGEEFPEMVQETFYAIKKGHPGEQITEAGVVGLMECAKKLPVCEDPDVWHLVERRLPEVLRRVYDAVKPSTRYRNVLCHSDLWQNNVLFRRDSSGRPLDVALVDFQLLRYAPPAHDIFNLLYLSTRRAIRELHEQEFLDVYYATLGATLRDFGLNVEHVLPRAEFDASLEDQRLAGRLAGVFYLHFVLSSEEMMSSVFSDPDEYERTMSEGKYRAKLICTQFDRDEEYRERIKEVFMEILEKHIF